MLKIKSSLNVVVICAIMAGLFLIFGCKNSAEKKQMTDFIQEFGKTVEEYAKADDAHKAELATKLNSEMEKWTQMKMDMGNDLTPQALDKLDNDYQKYAKQFKSLSGKS